MYGEKKINVIIAKIHNMFLSNEISILPFKNIFTAVTELFVLQLAAQKGSTRLY